MRQTTVEIYKKPAIILARPGRTSSNRQPFKSDELPTSTTSPTDHNVNWTTTCSLKKSKKGKASPKLVQCRTTTWPTNARSIAFLRSRSSTTLVAVWCPSHRHLEVLFDLIEGGNMKRDEAYWKEVFVSSVLVQTKKTKRKEKEKEKERRQKPIYILFCFSAYSVFFCVSYFCILYFGQNRKKRKKKKKAKRKKREKKTKKEEKKWESHFFNFIVLFFFLFFFF